MTYFSDGGTRRIKYAGAGAAFVFAALVAAGPVSAQSNSVNSWGAWAIPPAPVPQAGVTPPAAPVSLPEQARRRVAEAGGIGGANVSTATGFGPTTPAGLKDIAHNVQQADLANRQLPASLQSFLVNPQVPDAVKRQVIPAAAAAATASSTAAATAVTAAIQVITVAPVTVAPVTVAPATVTVVPTACTGYAC